MQLSPRYEGPAVLTVEVPVDDPGQAVASQRRRLQRVLSGLTPEQWAHPSRCEGWSVQDVVVHLVTVNRFWEASVRGGLAGSPTRVLAAFDPVAHPDLLVRAEGSPTPDDVLERFVASNDGFLGVVAGLSGDDWTVPGESPIGHVALREVIDHALWDSWVHERDIVLPLGLGVADEPGELTAVLRYAAALGPAIAAAMPGMFRGTLAVEATDPVVEFVIDVDDEVAVRPGPAGDGVPCLRGRAPDLIEAISLRSPLPADAPPEWHDLLRGLATAFDLA